MKYKILGVFVLTISFVLTYLLFRPSSPNSGSLNQESIIISVVDIGSVVLVGLAYIFSFLLLINELKSENNVWRGLVIFAGISFFFFNSKYGGASSVFYNGILSLFREPITWMLIGTLFGHLALLIYKRSKQMN
jgi:uncharacterized membrane protein YeaQ/YmgE (transglycosylase-associated protein family)